MLDDSDFMVDRNAGLDLFPYETNDSLGGVFSYKGVGGQRQSRRSWTFARVVTDSVDEVEFFGELVAERRYRDGSGDELFELEVDTLLSDIEIGPAPTLGDFPEAPPVVFPTLPPTDPVDPPPVFTPPIVNDPPINVPPVYVGPTRDQYINHLNRHPQNIPIRIKEIQGQLTSLQALLAAASDPDFDPASHAELFQLFPGSASLGGVLITTDGNWQFVETTIEPTYPTVDETLEGIQTQEIHLVAGLEMLEKLLAEIGAGLLAAEDPESQPDGLPIFPYVFVSYYPLARGAIIDAVSFPVDVFLVEDSVNISRVPSITYFGGGLMTIGLSHTFDTDYSAGSAGARVLEPCSLLLAGVGAASFVIIRRRLERA